MNKENYPNLTAGHFKIAKGLPDEQGLLEMANRENMRVSDFRRYLEYHRAIPKKKAIALREPTNAVETVESWAGMATDARKRRAAKAGNEDIREELQSLQHSYILEFSKSGTDTSPRTFSAYWRGACKLLDWCAENGLKPHKITSEEVSRFIVSMAKLAPKTRQLYLSGSKTMIAALRWAGMGEGDPFIRNGRAIQIKDPNPPEDKPDPYTTKEITKLLKGATDRERALILLGADAGMRLAEIASLQWTGIDAEREKLTFTGKGGKIGKIDVTPRVIAALVALPRDGELVFGIGRSRIQQIFTKRCQDMKVKPRGVHNLRHTCGTRLYEITRDLLVVKRHLGHSSTTTSEIYAHLADGDYQDAVKLLETNGYA